MPVEMSLPFRVADDGGIAIEDNPDRQIRQRVDSLVATEPGERVMIPAFGVALSSLVFETDEQLVSNETKDLVSSAMQRFEPGVIVLSVNVIPGEEGFAGIDVKYTRSDAGSTDAALARNVNTAEVQVGGEVREVIRG